MPIRTDRGHAAAMRRFWSWPLQSRTHAAGTLLVGVALVTGVACSANALTGNDLDPGPASTSHTATSPATSSVTSTPSGPASSSNTSSASTSPSPTTSAPQATGSAPTSQAAPVGRTKQGTAGAITTARGFMLSWVRPPAGASYEQWASGVRPYVMPENQIDLASIDPANIPATRVTGEPTPTKTGQAVVEADVPTDAGAIHLVIVAHPDGRWLVRSWTPVE